ncbi:hypothetical protein Cgig2_030570 [Carnegiea gigantea]|uniref:Peptidase A2 domain-containing protein n=1 Tax=Carnegiea gigantea TaxID=171969 RepID=A0A9Q1GNU1_9CARY|nr:hypothetical protein Cgig2_030570 [Carnegiea gigantea]
MEAVSSARPPPPFDYPLVHEGEPSHRPEGIPSLRPTECGQEISRSDQSSRAQPGQLRQRTAMEPTCHPQPLLHPMQHIPGELLGLRSRSKLLGQEERTLKVLYELADEGQFDRFLKRGPRLLRQEQEPILPPPRDEECSTEAVATIAGGYAEGITRSAWKAQLRSAQTLHDSLLPHNDPLVIKMKIASAIVRRILIDTGRSVDIITWDCLKKLVHPERDIIPLVNPILGFGGQEVNPTGMIRLPVRFGDKTKSRGFEVDFLVVNVPTAYNGQHDLAEVPEGVRAALLASRSACTLSQRHWYRETSPSTRWHSTIALTLRAKTLTMATSSSVTLGGCEAP